MKSIIRDPDAEKKIELFSKVEVLKSSRRIVDFYAGHPDARYYQQQAEFVDKFGAQIDADEAGMWPPNPATGRKPSATHWTLTNLRQRAKNLGTPFDRIYEVHYAHLSWMTYS
jgi:hypothetical protein